MTSLVFLLTSWSRAGVEHRHAAFGEAVIEPQDRLDVVLIGLNINTPARTHAFSTAHFLVWRLAGIAAQRGHDHLMFEPIGLVRDGRVQSLRALEEAYRRRERIVDQEREYHAVRVRELDEVWAGVRRRLVERLRTGLKVAGDALSDHLVERIQDVGRASSGEVRTRPSSCSTI